MRYLMVAVLISFLSIYTYSQVYIPNAFTPNGDGDNDVFLVITNDTLVSFNLTIFNLDGKIIFYTIDPKQAWVGGYEYYVPDGVYIYKLVYKNENQFDATIKTGNILLVR